MDPTTQRLLSPHVTFSVVSLNLKYYSGHLSIPLNIRGRAIYGYCPISWKP